MLAGTLNSFRYVPAEKHRFGGRNLSGVWQNKGNEVFVRVVLSYVGKAKYIYVFITAEAYIDTRKTFDRIEMATAANAEINHSAFR